MKANVRTNIQKVKMITNPAEVIAAEAGELFVGKKPVLLVKNGNTEAACCQIYLRFSRETDGAGNPFVFSRKLRSLAHTDPVWGNRAKVSGPQFEAYLSSYFQFAEKVTNTNGDALILTDQLPKFFSALISQPRYTSKFVDLFEMVD